MNEFQVEINGEIWGVSQVTEADLELIQPVGEPVVVSPDGWRKYADNIDDKQRAWLKEQSDVSNATELD